MNENQGELQGFEKPKNSAKKQPGQTFEDNQRRIHTELGIEFTEEPRFPQKNKFSVIDPRTEGIVEGKVAQDKNGNTIWCYEDGKIITDIKTIADIYKQLHPNENEISYIRMQIGEEIARWRIFNTPEKIIEVKQSNGIPLSKTEKGYNRKRQRGREVTLIRVGARRAKRKN